MRNFVLLAIGWLGCSISLLAQNDQVGAFIFPSERRVITLGAQGARAAVRWGSPSHFPIPLSPGRMVNWSVF